MITINFSPFPVLKTDRLILRQLESTDENTLFELRSDDSVNQYIAREKAASMEDVRNYLDKINTYIKHNESILWGIVLKDSNELAGSICLWNISKETAIAEVGYELLPRFQKQGIMQEALSTVIKYGFENMHLQKIEACLELANVSSVKLLEKFNFQRDTDSEHKLEEEEKKKKMAIYALNASDWI